MTPIATGVGVVLFLLAGLQPPDTMPPARQNPFTRIFEPDDGAHPRHLSKLEARFAAEIESGQQDRILGALADDFQARFSSDPADLDGYPLALRRFASELAGSSPDETLELRSAIVRLTVSPSGTDVTLFAGTGSEVVIPREVRFLEAMRHIRYDLRFLAEVLKRETVEARGRAAEALAQARARWQAYLFDGYSQYPWELAANSWLWRNRVEHTPPPLSLVLAHPSVAVEIPTDGFTARSDLTAKEALEIEVVGFVHYFDDHDKFWGLSGIVSLREDADAGIGATLHYDGIVHAGVVWRDFDSKSSRSFVVVGVDLYRLFERRQDLAERVGKFVGGE